MTTYVRYGSVLVASSIVITGVLWTGRESQAVRGEDVAALLSGVEERKIALFIPAVTNAPFVTSSNTLPANILWQKIYTEAQSAARDLAAKPTGKPGLFWIQPDTMPASGEVVAGGVGGWTHTVNAETGDYYYSPSVTDQIYTGLASTDSRVWRTGINYVRNTYPYLPVPHLFFPNTRYYSINTNGCAMWPSGNWWTETLGNDHTNVYAFWCEKFTAEISNAFVAVSSPAPKFTVSTNLLEVPNNWNGGGAGLGVSSADTNTVNANSAIVTLTSSGKSPTEFVVTDVAAATRAWFTCNVSALVIPEGSDGQVDFVLRSSLLIEEVPFATCSVTPGFSLIAYPAPFTPVNKTLGALIRVQADEDSDTKNKVGILTFTGIGSPYAKTVMALVKVDNDSTTNNGVMVDKSLVEVAKSGASENVEVNVYPPTSDYEMGIRFDKSIRTKALDETSAILNGLRSTAYVIDLATHPEALEWSSCTRYIRTGDPASASSDSESEWTYSASDEVTRLQAAYAAAAVSTNTASPVFSSGLVLFNIGGSFSTRCMKNFADTDTPQYTYSGFHDSTLTTTRYSLSGCRVRSYPSAWALQNGYVTRIRIYGIFDGQLASFFYRFAYPDIDSQYGSSDASLFHSDPYDGFFVGHETTPANFYDGKAFGTGISIGEHSTPVLRNTFSNQDTVSLTFVPSSVKRWTLLDMSEENPTDYHGFTLAAAAPAFGLSDFQRASCYYQYDYPDDYAGTWSQYKMDIGHLAQTIRMTHIVIVVDWRWKHFGSQGYEPEQNFPTW